MYNYKWDKTTALTTCISTSHNYIKVLLVLFIQSSDIIIKMALSSEIIV